MSKTNELASAFVQQHQITQVHAIRSPINAFNALFAVQELDEKEQRALEKIVVDGYEPGAFPERGVNDDISVLKRLTKELKAIKKQELILIGERLAEAREIFKKYKEGSFRSWVGLTFGSFKTGYNYLAFFDLYSSIPDELKERLKEMPSKAAYILASKKAPIEKKVAIVKEHGKESSSNLILLIQEMLQQGRSVQTTSPIEKILGALERELEKLIGLKELLETPQKRRIRSLAARLQKL